MSHRRFRAALAALLLLGSLTIPTTATAHPVSGSHLYGSCASGSTSYNDQPRIDPLARTNNYDFVGSTITISDLFACDPQNGTTNYGWSIVNPANLLIENQSSGGLLQLGYGVCSSTICNGTWPSNIRTEEFWYTKNSNGVIYAATWVDFNNDGVHDRPVVGRSYQFSIAIVNPTLSTAYIAYCIKDLYTALTDCSNVTLPYSKLATYPWWSYERQNNASTVGAAEGNPGINMRLIKYSTNTTGVITMTGAKTVYGDNLSYLSFLVGHRRQQLHTPAPLHPLPQQLGLRRLPNLAFIGDLRV